MSDNPSNLTRHAHQQPKKEPDDGASSAKDGGKQVVRRVRKFNKAIGAVIGFTFAAPIALLAWGGTRIFQYPAAQAEKNATAVLEFGVELGGELTATGFVALVALTKGLHDLVKEEKGTPPSRG